MSFSHAILAPSFAPVWGHCSGAVQAALQHPQGDTQYTLEGTAAHWVGSECLESFKDPNGAASMCSEWLGKTAPNGVVITQEMTDAAQVYVSDVLTVANEFGGLRQLLIEHRVAMPHIHKDNWGTLDCALVVFHNNKIYLWDYKHGHGLVEAEGNLQLVNYLSGLAGQLGIDGDADQAIDFEVRVVQPRCYQGDGPVSVWRGKLSDIRPYVNQLTHQAHEAMTAPKLTSGTHCRYCPAILNCPAVRKANYRMFDYVQQPFELDELSGPDLAFERELLTNNVKIAQARIDAITELVTHQIAQGDNSAGLTLESKLGAAKWVSDWRDVIAFGSMFGVDLRKPDCITPTQAVASVPVEMRETFEQAMQAHTRKKPGTPKLINIKDSRTAKAFRKRN